MSSQLFNAQLHFPDDNTSHQQLVHLIAAGKFTGPGLPDVARSYMDAFCNKSYSDGRRRWVGVALVGMMRASPSVVQRLKKFTQGPPRVGAVILDRDESEEHRIIAGLIVRQGLEAGLEFADFWESDRLLHSAPNFPRDSDEQWMGQFQSYLDTLSNSKLANLNTDPLILYPIYLSAKDGFQWTGKSAVAVIERDLLTIMASNSTLTKFHFIDIPVSHIKETRVEQDSPHESQEGRSGHSMHSLVMILRSKSPSYRLDSSDHTASEIKVSFFKREDADEFEVMLQDARKHLASAATTAPGTTGSTVTSSPENLRKPSTHRVDATVPPEHQENAHCSLDTGSADTLNKPVSLEQPRERQGSMQVARQEKGKGKLPRISKATKQKVVRTQQLPSGPSKVTKARASKRATPIIDESSDKDDNEEFLQDDYDLESTAQTRSSFSIGTGRKSLGRRKANAEDEDFVPNRSRSKPKSTKRKRGSNDTAEHSQPANKKTQTKSSDATGPLAGDTMAKKQKTKAQDSAQADTARSREPTKKSTVQQNILNGVSARHSLIGGLLKSKAQSKAPAPTFKKPGQPASTPGRPRAQPTRTTPKPQTPIETCKDLDGLPVYVSSTPRSQSIHEEDFGLGNTPVDSDILSSNTKRVPDSPHAESTAISGHADQEDVHREKRIGDLETAKSDPFQQRRQGQRMTTFIRKLTGESLLDSGTAPIEPLSMLVEAANDDYEADELAINSASQPLPKHSPSLFNHHTQSHHQVHMHDSPARLRDFNDPSANANKTTTATSYEAMRSLKFEAACTTNTLWEKLTRAPREVTPTENSRPASVARAGKDRGANENVMGKRAQPNGSIISTPQEVIEDTLLEALCQEANADDLDGETTLVGEEVDMFERYGGEASDLRFRSSPPIPDSSSVRDVFSDESGPEPEPSPPTSRIDELEWEASLQPHQRDLHEQLLRTSKRVTRHIVDNETAVTDIADVFADDGERLLNLLLERQSDESAQAFQELTSKRQGLLKEFSDASKNLKLQRKQVKAVD